MTNKSKPGRGWHGDPMGHALAGKRGGMSRSKNKRRVSLQTA